jgi:hypothetical protein
MDLTQNRVLWRALVLTVEPSGSAIREFILHVHKGHFQIYMFLILKQPNTVSEMRSPNLKAKDVIMCYLMRVLHARGELIDQYQLKMD